MNKLLKFFGGLFLLLLLVAGIAAAIFIPKGLALDKDAIAYIETNVPLIVATWNSEELLTRAAPEILQPGAKQQMSDLFAWFSKLGKLQKLHQPVGRVGTGVYPGSQFNGTWGDYVANADFEGGTAQIKVVLRRNEDSWQIMGFHVNSPKLLPSKN